MVTKFEDLLVWKESIRLSIDLINGLKDSKMYGLKDQMVRSAISVPSNIAEGFERESKKEFVRFLNIALASCGELRTQLFIAQEVKMVEHMDTALLIEKTRKISAMLQSLINTVRKG